ncbi:LamG domain-containing protein [Streptomyces sp. NPDC001599]|uniref:LamG domain-containing protein n=1 Tax=Streptomyces sp. NPDC001599 TaxID=3364591 RepID=UPI0036CAE5BC
MQPTALMGYTQEEVLAALQGVSGTRQFTFRYELLDTRNGVIREIDNVLSASVEYNFLADIKRTAKFSVLDDGSINFLSDRIRPWARMSMSRAAVLPPPKLYEDVMAVLEPSLLMRYKLNEAPAAPADMIAHDSGPHGLDLVQSTTPGQSPTTLTFGAPKVMQNGGTSIMGDGDSLTGRMINRSAGPVLNGLNAITLAAWITPTDESTCGIVGSSTSPNWGLNLWKTSNTFGIDIPTEGGTMATYSGQVNPTPNQSYFVVGTWVTGQHANVYVNGQALGGLLYSARTTGAPTAPVGPITDGDVFYLGSSLSGAFIGSIDEVAVFDRALSAQEIQDLYEAGQRYLAVNDRPGYVEWPQGVFLLTSPTRKANDTGVVTRDVDAYDQLLIYRDDVVTNRYAVAAGSKYTDAIEQLLGTSVDKNITRSALELPTTMEWEPGTPKLSIINALLNAINYESLFFDEYGTAVARPYVQPADRESEHTYATDDRSVILPDAEQTLDLFDVPNSFTLVVSDPDRPPLTSTYVNNDPGSITSTVSRGRTIVKYMPEQTAPDQATLDTAARNAAFDASQIYESITFTTGLMPIHSNADVYTLTYNDLGISAKYGEQSWSMVLEAGAKMKHTCRRSVQLNGS